MAAAALMGAFSLSRIFSALPGVVFRFGATTFAARMAVTLLRTAGYLQNAFPELYTFPGLPSVTTPAGRLLRPVPTFLNPLGFGFPFIGSFLSGFAFKNQEEVKTGWLSFFGELLLSPVVEGDTEEALKDLGAGDAAGFFDELGEAFSEETGLDFLASFFQGLGTWSADVGQVLGIPLPGNIVGESVIWVDAFLDTFGGAFSWIADLLGVPIGGPAPRPPTPEELATGEEEIRRRLRQAGRQAELKGGDLAEVEKAARRIVRRLAPGSRKLVEEFLGEAAREKSPERKRNLIQAVQRILRFK